MNYRNFFFALFTFIGINQAQAQVTFKPGIQAGINISKLTNSNLGNKTDFYIGGFGALKLSKFYTLQPELTYSRQGGKGNVSMGTTTIYDYTTNSYTITNYEEANVNVSLQYISGITINKFNFTESFYVLVGPFCDILIADTFKVDPKDKERDFSKGDDIDLGIIGGLGYSLKNGVSFEARIKKGFTSTLTNYYAYSTNNTNLVYQIGATYIFGK
ncbi:PorT family protein [Flavobacterium sp. LS1R49]|uniref:PorT family protein n=1 Tax=Flavobacterium shii TaxID=2987687 RepID=A0A9X2ZHU4_9FLAO|nr:PorT family protein [Flavobacterium shii]MCV9929625.1 PorT family protein [Flavobacterium shii]